jgi:hypothetical protein
MKKEKSVASQQIANVVRRTRDKRVDIGFAHKRIETGGIEWRVYATRSHSANLLAFGASDSHEEHGPPRIENETG